MTSENNLSSAEFSAVDSFCAEHKHQRQLFFKNTFRLSSDVRYTSELNLSETDITLDIFFLPETNISTDEFYVDLAQDLKCISLLDDISNDEIDAVSDSFTLNFQEILRCKSLEWHLIEIVILSTELRLVYFSPFFGVRQQAAFRLDRVPIHACIMAPGDSLSVYHLATNVKNGRLTGLSISME